MADSVDEANDNAAAAVERQVMAIRKSGLTTKVLPLSAQGKCLNCLEKIPVGRFCDADCREDYEKRTIRSGR